MLTSEDLYESMHWRELALRDKLDSLLPLPLTLGASIVGALVILVNNVDTKHSATVFDYLFIFFLAITLLCLFAAGFFFFRASVGSFARKNRYLNLPPAEDLEKFASEWSEYKIKEVAESAGRNAAQEARRSLTRRYLRCQKVNAAINDLRGLYIVRLQLAIVVATMLGGLTFAVFFFGGLGKTNYPTPQNVRIINLSDLCATSRK